MGDEEGSDVAYRVEYLDGEREGKDGSLTWISRAGLARVRFANGDEFEGETKDGGEEEFDEDDDGGFEETGDTGFTQNQNRLLYMISLYTHCARNAKEKEEWIRRQALLVLIYECVVEKVSRRARLARVDVVRAGGRHDEDEQEAEGQTARHAHKNSRLLAESERSLWRSGDVTTEGNSYVAQK